MKKRISILFFLILLLSPYASAYSPRITGIIHYRGGFLVLTHYPNNTTQLWFFEPGKGLKLLNATFPNLAFIHSTGNRVLMYQNLSDIYSAPDVQLYTYDGKFHHLGDFNGVTDCGDKLYIYWNGEFYLLFQPWDACQMTGYDWYAIVNGSIFKLPGDDRGWSTVRIHSKRYVDNLQVVPHGYMVGYTDFYTQLTTLRLVTLSSTGIRIKNITFGNLYADWAGACFNGTHFATILGNWMEVPVNNESVLRFYLAIINTRGDYKIIPLDSIPSNDNVSLELLGSYDGKWVVKKYWFRYLSNSSGGYKKTKTLGYFIVSPKGVVEVGNETKVTAICRRNYPQLLFEGRHVVKSPLKLKGRSVAINGTILFYAGRTFKLPFNATLADCGNGCLLSNGKELAYFNGVRVEIVKFPSNQAMIHWLILFGITFTLLLAVWLMKARRQ
ncbi:hypothetical protein E3E35_00365 [Thermococcus sp. GR7]|uniref:hypothetical protein n=1 Tax=unclassified Thermococcus TaxID=2627626 RepID=UPI00142FD175|nr:MULTISPECIES: hypothetical protein [unclassified Thermococcus]NJE45885.1 hypothetical protein [Thermococcus sp. GR7]NJE78776.1 hypothetical protein [Thermococcus sp. GR4]NJF22080.1 hypothetical protein [Thermococcus sp. GR5]